MSTPESKSASETVNQVLNENIPFKHRDLLFFLVIAYMFCVLFLNYLYDTPPKFLSAIFIASIIIYIFIIKFVIGISAVSVIIIEIFYIIMTIVTKTTSKRLKYSDYVLWILMLIVIGLLILSTLLVLSRPT